MSKKGNNLVLTKTRHARTTWERFMGLLGVSPREHHYALIFHLGKSGKLNAGIHMLFMRMPIDVLFLDENKKIVDFIEQLQPWNPNYTPRKESLYIVELPAGTLHDLNIKLNKTSVSWKEK